jgi:molybdopterin synthase sulfur carrier subunit
MTAVVVLVPGVLRPYADGSATLEVDSEGVHTIGDLLARVERDHPALGRRLRDERGSVRRHVNLYVDGADIRHAQQLETPVGPGVEVLVVPAVSGG